MKWTVFVVVAFIALLVMADPVRHDDRDKDKDKDKDRRTADVELDIKNVRCVIKKDRDCKWKVDKKITDVDSRSWNPNNRWRLKRGDCIRIEYAIIPKRECKEKFEKRATGKIVVKNEGRDGTKDLKVIALLEMRVRGSEWREIARKEVTKGTEVRAGNTESFDFEFSNFEHAPNSEFRVRAIATLDNQKNCRRAPCTVRERSEQFNCRLVDGAVKGACAVITDDISDLTSKLSCEPDRLRPEEICDDNMVIQQKVRCCNDNCNLKCEKDDQLCNTAKIFGIDKKGDKLGQHPDAQDTECLKVKIRCPKGRNKDKYGRKCGGDECERCD